MTEQTIAATTPLSSLAEHAAASTDWWKEGAPERNELELPTRVLVALGNAGIVTVAQLRAAGPNKLRKLDHIGKLGFQQIIDLLRALDRQSNGGGA